MKYMKLGSKPDIFLTDGNVRTLATELASDAVFQVEDAQFHLHKFPMLSKCGRLHRLLQETDDDGVIKVKDIPGGVEAFELCAKFCYGISITLSAHNVLSICCAADYLGMTETMDKGNLIFKLEVFLNSSVFRSWKDPIIALKSTKALLPWSQDLKLVSRCIDAIASKTSVDPLKVDWSFTYSRSSPVNDISPCNSNSPPWNGIRSHRNKIVPKDWWVEDISDLEIDLYWKVMVAIKSKGIMSHELIGEALTVYANRSLPGISKDQYPVEAIRGGNGSCNDQVATTARHKLVLETIVSLMPAEKGSCSCSFMLKLLKAATILDAANSSKMELARRIGFQLEEASLNDLLIPSMSYADESLYDTDLVQRIVEHFMSQDHSPSSYSPLREQEGFEKRRSRSADQLDFSGIHGSAIHSSKLRVAKLIDGYLAEIARDPNLPLPKFMFLAESIPDFARPVHDGLYRAIDIYLKEHPALTKSERKKICRLMDCKKLSMDACMHAAQNERLPLRVVVQVLFFEQVRTAMAGGFVLNDIPSSIKALLPKEESPHHQHGDGEIQEQPPEDDWESVHQDVHALRGDLARMKQKIAEAGREQKNIREEVMNKLSKTRSMLSSSKKMLTKLLSMKNTSPGSKDSEFSKSSGSSVSSVVQGENQNVPRRRNSVS